MTKNQGVRSFHRWVSVAFTVTVVANIAVMSAGHGQPPPWITYSPLFPLALLQVTGIYLFVLPYTAKRRGARSTGSLAE
jgi:hypothetical protein